MPVFPTSLTMSWKRENQKDAYIQRWLCVHADTSEVLHVPSTHSQATAEMSQRATPLGMLLAVLFQSLCSCPFQLHPSSQVTALGKGQKSLLWVLLHCLFHSLKTKIRVFFSLLSFLFVSFSVNQSKFWFVQTEFAHWHRKHLAFTGSKQCFHPWMVWVRNKHINHHPCWLTD